MLQGTQAVLCHGAVHRVLVWTAAQLDQSCQRRHARRHGGMCTSWSWVCLLLITLLNPHIHIHTLQLDVARGMAYLHSRKPAIIHRCVSPAKPSSAEQV